MPENDESEQLALNRQLVALAEKRTRMSAERSELAAERSYMNAERTLSVWIRTALALMIFGIAIDRFGLLLHRMPTSLPHAGRYSDVLSNWTGVALVALGVLMVLTTGVRFLAYVSSYRREHRLPYHHGPFLAPFFALMTALFGVALLIVLIAFAE